MSDSETGDELQIDPAVAGNGAEQRSLTLGQAASEVLWLMTQTTSHRHFFIADAEAIQGDPMKVTGSGELQGLHWLTIEDARGLDLPNITRVVLDELDERLSLAKAAQARRAVPFVYFRNGNAIRDAIGN